MLPHWAPRGDAWSPNAQKCDLTRTIAMLILDLMKLKVRNRTYLRDFLQDFVVLQYLFFIFKRSLTNFYKTEGNNAKAFAHGDSIRVSRTVTCLLCPSGRFDDEKRSFRRKFLQSTMNPTHEQHNPRSRGTTWSLCHLKPVWPKLIDYENKETQVPHVRFSLHFHVSMYEYNELDLIFTCKSATKS